MLFATTRRTPSVVPRSWGYLSARILFTFSTCSVSSACSVTTSAPHDVKHVIGLALLTTVTFALSASWHSAMSPVPLYRPTRKPPTSIECSRRWLGLTPIVSARGTASIVGFVFESDIAFPVVLMV